MAMDKGLNKGKRVAVGLSGGVDSSVAAYLLLKQGYEVTGVHMRCWDYNAPGCRGNEDRADAIKIAATLDIPFVDLNFENEYRSRVLNYFFDELKAGRTPNPDVMCNKEIKFGLFLDWALRNGFDFVATGHYARIAKNPKKVANENPKTGSHSFIQLLSGVDTSKDQSYFLYKLTQKTLGYILFPVGDFTKDNIRKIAKEAGLKTHNKKDSTGICFIGDIDVKDFIKSHIDVKKGKVLDIEGNVIGEHEGVSLYTIGQRHGFTVTKYQGLPLYVISKDASKNTITVGFGKDAQTKTFEVSDLNWINPGEYNLASDSLECLVRIRNLGDKLPAKIHSEVATLHSAKKIKVELVDYTLGVAPGQSAVFYDGDILLGGGTIS